MPRKKKKKKKKKKNSLLFVTRKVKTFAKEYVTVSLSLK